jgi:hypothetical protein
MDKFIGHVLQVLSNCSRDDVVNLVKNKRELILNIGRYIGVNYYGLGEKLLEAIGEMAKSMRN